MKWLTLILLMVVSAGCGSALETNDSRQDVVQSGESTTNIIIDLKYIAEVRELCEAAELPEDYESRVLYDQAVAQCTLDNIQLLNLNVDGIDTALELCEDDADLSGFSPEEQADILATCQGLQ